jgi:hypothetical protein
MPTSPNFIQLEALLRHAIEYQNAHPSSSSGGGYLDALVETLETFRETRHETDRDYLSWRNEYHDTMTAHKAIRLAYDSARNECVEWGLGAYPDHYVSYMDEPETREVGVAMVAFLEGVDLDDDWVTSSAREIQAKIDAADQAATRQATQLGAYKRTVRVRKIAYDNAYELVRDHFKEIRHEFDRDSDDYLRLCPAAF